MKLKRQFVLIVLIAVGLVVLILVLFKPSQPPRPKRGERVQNYYYYYWLDAKQGGLKGESSLVSATCLEDAVGVMLDSLKKPSSPDYLAPMPKDAHLLSVKHEGETLTLDFSRPFAAPENWQGSDIAYLRLQAIVLTVAQLPGVKQVKILVQGKTPQALGGHEDVSQPIKPDYGLAYGK